MASSPGSVRSMALSPPPSPGLAAALEQLARDYGRLSLADSLAPAIGLARDGFRIGERYHRLARFRQKALAKSPEASGIFLVDGKAPAVGAVIVQADLANTLSLLAKQGAKAFYHGELARKLVDGVIADGGIWTLDDLANYRTQMRRPIIVDYHDIRVVSAGPPSSGGLVLAQALNILEGYDLAPSIRRRPHACRGRSDAARLSRPGRVHG